MNARDQAITTRQIHNHTPIRSSMRRDNMSVYTLHARVTQGPTGDRQNNDQDPLAGKPRTYPTQLDEWPPVSFAVAGALRCAVLAQLGARCHVVAVALAPVTRRVHRTRVVERGDNELGQPVRVCHRHCRCRGRNVRVTVGRCGGCGRRRGCRPSRRGTAEALPTRGWLLCVPRRPRRDDRGRAGGAHGSAAADPPTNPRLAAKRRPGNRCHEGRQRQRETTPRERGSVMTGCA